MLITFSCPAHADVIMFGDVAIRLIKMTGHSGTVPSAILAEGVPAALTRLQAAVGAEGRAQEHPDFTDDDDEEAAISLRLRAGPLLDLFEAAKTANCDVMWDHG